MAKKKTTTTDPNLTLAQLSQGYLDHIEKDGKSLGTCFSYCMELKVAHSELGADTLVSALTADAIEKFNKSKRVTKLKTGKPKSQLSIDKTRRVIRLALAWAEQSGLIEKSPIAAKASADDEAPTAAPTKKSRKAKVIVAKPAGPDTTTPDEPATPVEASAA